jgi:hypothetical protein
VRVVAEGVRLNGISGLTDDSPPITTLCIRSRKWARHLHRGRRESPREGVMVEYLRKARPQEEGVAQKVRDAVSEILSAVEKEGIAAVRRYSEQLDDWNPDSFVVSEARSSCFRRCPSSLGPVVAKVHSSVILPPTMRWMAMAL